ncbi:MAG TPA: hypothetical protein VL400_00150 [Polyangiaceae bacterium]|jgi:hypothetical protein|nr:hypothetical protein [Polyangiaceae bacterium]
MLPLGARVRSFGPLALLLSIGCGAAPATTAPTTAAPTAVPTAAAPDPDAAFAPLPYTADEIRKGCPEGRTIVLIEEVPDKLPVKKRMRFLAVDDERATVVSETLDEKDAPVGDPKTEIATWNQLRHHAAYPKEATTVSDATAETPAGTFPCKRYEVTDGDTKTTACFAKEMPGPPVEMSIEKAGKRVLTLTMVKSE